MSISSLIVEIQSPAEVLPITVTALYGCIRIAQCGSRHGIGIGPVRNGERVRRVQVRCGNVLYLQICGLALFRRLLLRAIQQESIAAKRLAAVPSGFVPAVL